MVEQSNGPQQEHVVCFTMSGLPLVVLKDDFVPNYRNNQQLAAELVTGVNAALDAHDRLPRDFDAAMSDALAKILSE